MKGLREALERWNPAADAGERRSRAAELLRLTESDASTGLGSDEEVATWRRYLEATGRPEFLEALEDRGARERWAATTFVGIRRARYDLETLLAQRAGEHPGRILFEQEEQGRWQGWSYQQVQRRVQAYAAALLDAGGPRPRVALYLTNSLAGACADLACLCHGLFVTPLSVHFDVETLAFVVDRLAIDVAVTDSDERARRLLEASRRWGREIRVLATRSTRLVERGDLRLIDEWSASWSMAEIEERLASSPRAGLDDPCTVMFTSGSTGRPKGIVFTPFHLLSKRFARAAALPSVGRDEVLLCYLPLFHTFGRYLEMLGTLFWRGRYVFARNPSAETLLRALPEVAPTGLIGIPLRWAQIADRCREVLDGSVSDEGARRAFRSVVGERLRWGLSAAGYLAPRDFRFLRRFGVALCSGFGMTEATGGITMNPPDDYVDRTVGLPLPGMEIRYSDEGEMWIGGAYVARYLREDGRDFELEEPARHGGKEWLRTGDLFERLDDGHVTIVDRLKDIYKNSRGQTVAPRRVEACFHGVPGIRRVFLVGDHRAYNVLLVVPDLEDPVLAEARDESGRREYFHQIVAAANRQLAPFERVVVFALLDRDFDLERGEVTPKGSYRRKVIEDHFREQISRLYERDERVLETGGVRVRIPRWVFRDLGVLETDFVTDDAGLVDTRRGLRLAVERRAGGERLLLGDLEYRCQAAAVDLGTWIRQPTLWVGNPALFAFAPCRDGWDVPHEGIPADVVLPDDRELVNDDLPSTSSRLEDGELVEVHRLVVTALFGATEEALVALRDVGRRLPDADGPLAELIRGRISALAWHPEHRLRAAAYREILLDEPRVEEGIGVFSFLESGQTFLDEESIEILARESLGKRRLEALRRRLLRHRRHYSWPARGVAFDQFSSIFRLLLRVVEAHPVYFNPVRQELACWALHPEDSELAARARALLDELEKEVAGRRAGATTPRPARPDPVMLRFDQDLDAARRRELKELLWESSFLEESIRSAFDTYFSLEDLADNGIWVSLQRGGGDTRLHRVSVNTRDGRHFDLLVTLFRGVDPELARETILWTLAVSGHVEGTRVMPRFGCLRPDRSAVSLEFIDGLTLGERIRQLAVPRRDRSDAREIARWRRLFVRGMATVFRAFAASGERIVPGLLNPRNVVVPERDFHEEAMLLSLAGWQEYRKPSDLFEPLHASFFSRTLARYPSLGDVLERAWIFDACLEGLGPERGKLLLEELNAELRDSTDGLARELDDFLEWRRQEPYRPLPLENAIARYDRWIESNDGASAEARSDLVQQLLALYRLDRFGEEARYRLYRETCFAACEPPVAQAFDRLLEALHGGDRPATRLVELSDLRASLTSADDRRLFARLVFPRARVDREFEIVTFGESDSQRVTLKTSIVDARGRQYSVREPIDAEEIGSLYRLFYLEKLPKAIGGADRHLIAVDGSGRLVAGLSFRFQGRRVVQMDGVVVGSTSTRRGIGRALVEDLVERLSSIGVGIVKTGYLYPEFLGRCGFRVDRRWGGLVRELGRHGPPTPG